MGVAGRRGAAARAGRRARALAGGAPADDRPAGLPRGRRARARRRAALRRRGAARPALRLPAVRRDRLRAADGAPAAGAEVRLDGGGRGAGRVRRAPVGGPGRDASRPGGRRAARGGAARARPDPHHVLPRPDQRHPAGRGARRRHRAAGPVARGRGGAGGRGEADAAGVRRLPAADRPDAGRGHGDGDVRRGGGRRVPRRAGGAGDAEQALADAARVLDASVSPSRPLFLAYIGSTGLEIGVLASALAATYDANLATTRRRRRPRRGAGRCAGSPSSSASRSPRARSPAAA